MFRADLAKLQSLLRKIPQGKITTYGLLAEALGVPGGGRYVGLLLKTNPEPEKYPCYKVIKTNGEIGGYSGGVKEKIRLLNADNVIIKKRKAVDFKRKIFKFNMPKD